MVSSPLKQNFQSQYAPGSTPQVSKAPHRVERTPRMASLGTIPTQGISEKTDLTHVLPGDLMFAEESDMGIKSDPVSLLITCIFNDYWVTQATKGQSKLTIAEKYFSKAMLC